jgi:hypothetical protein
MRRFPLYTAILCAALFVITLGGWLYRHRPEPLPVLHLADGSVLRVEGLAWRGRPIVRLEPAWLTAAKFALPAAWRPPFAKPAGTFTHHGDEGLTLAFSWFQPASNAFLRFQAPPITHLGTDGTELPANGSGSATAGRLTAELYFHEVDWRDERLRFRLRDGTNDLDFSLPNPRRGEVFPQWPPEPLPQARTVAEFEFTLVSLKEVETPWKHRPPAWTPEVRVRHAGADVTGWFNLIHDYTDPTGNRSDERLAATEPVWRVRITAIPTLDFPFPDAAMPVRGTGPVPSPGEFRLLPAATGAASLGLDPVWLTGPGRYEFHDGTNVWASAAAGPIQERLNPWKQGVVRYAAEAPQLWWRSEVAVAGVTDESPRHWRARVRRADGRPVELKPLRAPNGEDSQLEYLPNRAGFRRHNLHRYQLPAERVGEPLTVEVICLDSMRAEFTVAAPTVRNHSLAPR